MSITLQCRRILLVVGFIAAISGTGCRETSAPAQPRVEAKSSVEAKQSPEPAALPITAPAAVAMAQKVDAIEPVAPAPPLNERRDPDPSAACLAKTSDGGSTVASIHRWVDAAGVTHYSDQAPTTPVSGHRVLEVRGLPDIKVEASGYDVSLPSDLQRRAIVDAVAVQRVFHDTLGIDGPSHATLKIVFVGDADAYATLVGGGVLAASSGAFVPAQHTIYVRMQADEEVAFSILRHEITHALIHERVGDLPVPLNEGLAEYFRRYRPAGMGGQVDVAADHDGLVGAAPTGDGSEALVELMALAGTDFYTADRDRRYLRAYALIALLMRDTAGTAALHGLLARQQAEPCVPIRAEGILDETYPGGLHALAADWASFLRDPPLSVRAY
jgi:hypothetical protein